MEKVVKTINELCVKITDGAHNSPVECSEGSYKMYSSKDMSYNSFDDSGVKLISLEDYQKLVNQDCQPQKNDILIIKDGANYLKYVFRVPETIEAVILSSIAILRPNQRIINPDYFVYLLRTSSIRSAMSHYVSGAAIPRIVLKDFKKMKMDIVPALSVQKSISNILLSFDNLIEVNNKRIKALEQMAENLYKEWFVRFRFPGHEATEFENGIPKGWEYQKLNRVFDIRYGKDHKNIEDGNIPIFGSGGIMRYGDKSLYDGETVLIPRKGTLNNIMYYKGSFWTVDTMFYTVLLKENFAKYAYYMLSNVDMESYNTGAALPSMTTEILYHLKMLVPDNRTLKLFDDFVSDVFKRIDKLRAINDNLIKQRDLLLPRLMSGKLEVE